MLELRQLAPPHPVTQASVLLRDRAGDLIEMMATDADGLVWFDALEPGRHLVQVEYGRLTWQVGVILAEDVSTAIV